MARKVDIDRDHNPQADLEDLVEALAKHAGPSFRNGLTAKQLAALTRAEAKVNKRRE